MRKLVAALLLYVASVSAALAQADPSQVRVPPEAPAIPVVSSAVEGSHILKAFPGALLELYVTTGATPGYIMTFNSASVPADGAVTPINCVYAPATNTVSINWAPQPPEWNNLGIVAVFSSTGCFTKTLSATVFFHALVQ